MASVGGKANGQIVWSSSRLGNHDLFVMNTDGSNVHAITQGDAVDWFPRFSPDGSRILFTRSKKGWVYERDANTDGKWDIFTVTTDGKEETKVVDKRELGRLGHRQRDRLRALDRGIPPRSRRWRGEHCWSTALRCQTSTERCCSNPNCRRTETTSPSRCAGPSGKPGSGISSRTPGPAPARAARSTGRQRATRSTGCIQRQRRQPRAPLPVANGKPTKSDADLDAITLIDLPGRRSHEYFPQLSADGKWLVWAATQRGHDHDLADYEIYLWEVGTPADSAVRPHVPLGQ